LFASAIDNWFYSATTNNSAWEELKRLLIVDKFAVHIPTAASARNAAASTSSSASSAAAAAASGHSTTTDEVLLGQLAKRTNRLEWLSRQMHNKMVEKQFDWDMSAGQHESKFRAQEEYIDLSLGNLSLIPFTSLQGNTIFESIPDV
jgi:hypothetical protein